MGDEAIGKWNPSISWRAKKLGSRLCFIPTYRTPPPTASAPPDSPLSATPTSPSKGGLNGGLSERVLSNTEKQASLAEGGVLRLRAEW